MMTDLKVDTGALKDMADKLGNQGATAMYIAIGKIIDHLGILRWIPGNAWITRAMIRIDRVLCALPGLSLLGFHVVDRRFQPVASRSLRVVDLLRDRAAANR